MTILTFLLFIAGVALLIGGAEVLIRGAVRIATAMGIPTFIVGLTIVAFGTSAPELAVTVHGVMVGTSDIPLGNIIGSNIFNVLFILGISALIVPLYVARQIVRLDVPIMIGVSLVLILMSLDGRVGRVDGVILVVGFIAYTIFLIKVDRRTEAEKAEAPEEREKMGAAAIVGALLLVALGLGLLVWGAQLVIDSAQEIALALGVSELIVGLTILAMGTSLPEVATSIMAGIRKQPDITVGNVVGSNLNNILLVLGLGAILSPTPLAVGEDVLYFHYPVMLAAAVACLPIFFTGNLISRWEGLVLFGYSIAYILYIVFQEMKHTLLQDVVLNLMLFVFPLFILTFVIVIKRLWYRFRGRGSTAGD